TAIAVAGTSTAEFAILYSGRSTPSARGQTAPSGAIRPTKETRARPTDFPRADTERCENTAQIDAECLPNEAGDSISWMASRALCTARPSCPARSVEGQPSLIPTYQSSDRQLSEFRIRDAFPPT